MCDDSAACGGSDRRGEGAIAHDSDPDAGAASRREPRDRRHFLLLGVGMVLGGCATGRSNSSLAGDDLPSPPWPDPVRSDALVRRPAPTVAPEPVVASGSSVEYVRFAGVQSRAAWGAARGNASGMDPMLPIRHITIHHDAMFYAGRSRSDAVARMRRVQRGHQEGNGWADIGYHYVIDHQGTVWEGRPITWQGAHVKDRNEGNIGVMLMGNFEEQSPTSAQLMSLGRHVSVLQGQYGVAASGVRTHREWPGASTLCPGRTLQSSIASLRRRGAFA